MKPVKNFLQTTLPRSALVLWLILSIVLGGLLTLLHGAQLPVLATPPQRPSGRWWVLHILEEKCRCSQRVLASLLGRQAAPGVEEKVIYADGSETNAGLLRQQGFEVEICPAEELQNRCGQSASPLLVVTDPQGVTVYAGAYAASPNWNRKISRFWLSCAKASLSPPWPLLAALSAVNCKKKSTLWASNIVIGDRTVIKQLLKYVVLPSEITPFERSYLARTNRLALIFFLLHIPIFVFIAWLNQTNPLQALVLTSLAAAGPYLAMSTLSNPRQVSMVFGVTAMLIGALLVHFGRGIWTIEMHFYFFASLALLTVFGNPLVVLTGALTAALHHLIFWYFLPVSFFNYDAPVTTVLIHATFVVLESVAACYVARSFFDNVIGLDKIVQQRTLEVNSSNRDMRLVLDNVAQGLVTVDRQGMMASERSEILAQWLGSPSSQVHFWDYIGGQNSPFSMLFQLAWEELLDDILPLELLLDQLPKTLTMPERTLEFQYKPIFDDLARTSWSKILVVVSDITAQLQREAAEIEKQEMMEIFDKVINHRSAFSEFMSEADLLVGSLTKTIAGQPLPIIRRQVHTLKGNFSTYGLRSLSVLCHDIETRISDEAGLSRADKTRLKSSWQSLTHKVSRFVKTNSEVYIQLEAAELSEFGQRVAGGLARPLILQTISSWTLQPTQDKLEHFAEQAQSLGRRLGRAEIQFNLQSNRLRIVAKTWTSFWSSFTHALRNAVDHGIETAEERRLAGKPEKATIWLTTSIRDNHFVIELQDDGRGISWEKVRARAHAMGLPAETLDDLQEALFADGLTTNQEVSEFSGRGVGLGALRNESAHLGGAVKVISEFAKGTTFQFIFPLEAMGQRWAEQPNQAGGSHCQGSENYVPLANAS